MACEPFEFILPRHLQIIYEINRRFLEIVRRMWQDGEKMRESPSSRKETRKKSGWQISPLSAASVNGVSALHTEILKNELFNIFMNLA